MKLALLHQRVQLNLVNHRRDARFINQALQMMNPKLQTPMLLSAPLLQFNHPFPGINVMVDSRYRPVHEIKIDEIELEFLQTLLQRFAGTLLIVVPQLGGDESSSRGTPALASAFPTPSSFL